MIISSRTFCSRTAIVALIGLQLAIIAGYAQAESTTISIKGSTTILQLAKRIGQSFTRQSQELLVEVTGGGSVTGIQALIDGSVDIATSSTFISKRDLDAAVRRGVYPVPFRIAHDCIIPIVHRSNPLAAISREDLRRIYTGEVRNWRQLGGDNRAIDALQRDAVSGTYKVWQDLVLTPQKAKSTIPVSDSNVGIVAAVANNPNAIGYISLSFLSAGIKPLSVDGVMGSSRSLRDGSYPISRPLFLFTNGWPEGRVMQFVNFVLDPDSGQKMIAEAQYIPLR